MNSEGWIKLHRCMLENPVVCKDAEHMAVWVYLLLNATHQPRDIMWSGKRITLKPGELVTGRKKIAKALDISESKVQRILNLFKSEQQIEQRTNRQNRVISILAWDKYQQSEQQSEQRVNNEWTTSEQRVNTNKNNKNIKNVKNDKNIYGKYENVRLSDKDMEKLVNDFPLDYNDRIERLSEYMASKGKTYKNHLATIQSWARRDAKQKVEQKGRLDWIDDI